VGLKRHEFSADLLHALAEAHRLIYRMKVGLDHAREMLRAKDLLFPAVNHLLAFIQEQHDGRHGRSRERRRAA
jgi:UDP-N-acetylglucosamine acyltransferase